MAIQYKFAPSRNPKTGEAGYRVVIVQRDRLKGRHLAARISDGTTVTEEDAYAVLTRLVKVLHQELARGNSVTLDGLGTFRLVIQTGMVVDPKAFRPAGDIKHARISFRAKRELRFLLGDLEFVLVAA
jgi:predicted histone-like DNA-binding protein